MDHNEEDSDLLLEGDDTMKDLVKENAVLTDAITFAAERHLGQLRKGTTMPYIVHPLAVMLILAECDPENRDLMAAGVLHDVLEDTGTSAEEMRERFGDHITDLVLSHTDDKTLPWKERKILALKHLAAGNFEEQALQMADKLANLRDMKRDHDKYGEAVWEKFNNPYECVAWYYHESVEALKRMDQNEKTAKAYQEVREIVTELFG